MEKNPYMRSFISAAVEYTKHPSEASASVLQRNLGVIGASLDPSIFDPGSSIGVEFYVSLHELMNSLGSRSPLVWNALDTLQNACKNTAARQALVHTYKFAPILTRLLETNLTPEKRVKVLKLLQELTYGVKLSWQEAHLPYLISSLTQWVIQSKEDDVIGLSLGILVNLCYKNLPAVYTLARTVDTKTFIRALLKIQTNDPNTRVQCCKMLMILENDNGDISEKQILEFVDMTFTTLLSALKKRDASLLRHTVDFFDDVRQSEHSRSVLVNYEKYAGDVREILAALTSDLDPECVSLVMKFLLSLVGLRISSLVPLYPECVRVAMTWIPIEQVCSGALALIRTVVMDWRRMKSTQDVVAELDLSVLTLVAKCCNGADDGAKESENAKRSAEAESRLTELMQLLHEMAKITSLRSKVMQSFNEQDMRNVFRFMLEHDDSPMEKNWPGNLFNDPSTTLYIHALAFTADNAAHDSKWLTLYSELLQKKQVPMTLALALYTGDLEVKHKVFQLTSSVGFTQECISSLVRCMRELESLLLVQGSTGNASAIAGIFSTQNPSVEIAPLFSFNQESRLDASLARLEEAFDKNQIADVTTSAVMELYDYKLAAMRHAERATQASLEAADNHATSLRHRLAQVIAESGRLHQLLFHNQQCLEGIRAENIALTGTIQTQVKQIQEIPKLKKIVAEKCVAIDYGKKELKLSLSRNDTLEKKIKELESELREEQERSKEMHEKRAELKKKFAKLQENVSKAEQINTEREREIAEKREEISALKQDNEQLGGQCRAYEQTIAEKEENVERLSNELVNLSRMLDMINQITAKKKAEESNTTT